MRKLNLRRREGDRKVSPVQKQEDSPNIYVPHLSRTILHPIHWELSQFQSILECLSQLDAVLGADSITLQVFFCY